MSSITSYGKVHTLGQRETEGIFDGNVVIEEKIDGSQFSFMKDEEGKLHFRSRNADAGNLKEFNVVRQALEERKEYIVPGFVYRGEFLRSPRHNKLAYERVPKGHVMLWEIEYIATGERVSVGQRSAMAKLADLETVPVLHIGPCDNGQDALQHMPSVSVLGGCAPEGVVVKRGNQRAKIVTEAFRETQRQRAPRLGGPDDEFLSELSKQYATPARWAKAYQHLRDEDKITRSMKDIGPLIKETHQDIDEECSEEIGKLLFNHFRKRLSKGWTEGLAEWYKLVLMGEEHDAQ